MIAFSASGFEKIKIRGLNPLVRLPLDLNGRKLIEGESNFSFAACATERLSACR